ncbi:response regulator transcription factor [Croceimicrobium hydrocarbonivorans]|uniref:Response regulator transcription factor n=1 Tax=Croceimicrobium hydrocarbonivorans TaxID=2761580 RepID=A0A7H0VCX4_9FLAO|nr:response regulator transcription factor [Croceimicrobium hydrocarbonivorans]QNR23572.1 response regulator transcription factor [Croceimicrobium hydrocarbonivorans]
MKILIVEDETGIAAFLKQGLEEEAYTVVMAHDGNKGLQLALSDDYDLLLLDWMLPGMSGIAICQEFRKQNKKTPVILLTAKDSSEEVVFGLQAGANDYIRKPFHFDELLERIRVQLRAKSGETSHEALQLGEIRMDLSAHLVYRNDELIQLTQREFALLEFLLRNKNRVCRRVQILENVWDSNYNYNAGIIDVYINTLRKKLKLEGEDNYIQTIRGVGYIAREV